jgi:hypothetical protein
MINDLAFTLGTRHFPVKGRLALLDGRSSAAASIQPSRRECSQVAPALAVAIKRRFRRTDPVALLARMEGTADVGIWQGDG